MSIFQDSCKFFQLRFYKLSAKSQGMEMHAGVMIFVLLAENYAFG